jgi:hypothetical protein
MGLQNSGNFCITEELSSSFVLDRKIKCFQCELVVGLFDHIPVQEMAPNSFGESNFYSSRLTMYYNALSMIYQA